jgi:hypothetical protein
MQHSSMYRRNNSSRRVRRSHECQQLRCRPTFGATTHRCSAISTVTAKLCASSCAGIPVSQRVTGVHVVSELLRADSMLPAATHAPEPSPAQQPQPLAAWAVSSGWQCSSSSSASSAGFRIASRQLACKDVVTGTDRASTDCSQQSRPKDRQSCGIQSSPACSMFGEAQAQGGYCSSNGNCKVDSRSDNGSIVCKCSPGYRGVACQLPPSCGTVLDNRGLCCPTSLVSARSGVNSVTDCTSATSNKHSRPLVRQLAHQAAHSCCFKNGESL